MSAEEDRAAEDRAAIGALVTVASYLHEHFGVLSVCLGHIGRDAFDRIVRLLPTTSVTTRFATVDLGEGRQVQIEVREVGNIHVQADAGPIVPARVVP